MAKLDLITSSTRPASPAAGKAYFETDTNKVIIWDGSAWTEIVSDTVPAFSNAYSVNLDGSNDYIDCGGDADFSFTDGSGNDSAFSISAWVKLDDNLRARIAGKGSSEWLFTTDSNRKLSLYCWNQGSTSAYIGKFGSILTTGAWHHIVGTYDGSNSVNGITLYQNGSDDTSGNGSAGTYASMSPNQGALRIGQWPLNSSMADGLVDEVAVFDYELTSSQVSTIYNSGSPADISPLSPLGLWRMGDNNGGTGTTITDQGSGGNNGTLTNGPTFSSDVPS